MNIKDLDQIFSVLPERLLGRNFYEKFIDIPDYFNEFWQFYNSTGIKDEMYKKGYRLQKTQNNKWRIGLQFEKKIDKEVQNNSLITKFIAPKKYDLSKYHLYDYQIDHVNNLINGLKKYKCVWDASPPGMGKTICALSAADILNCPVIVFCPKPAVFGWLRTIDKFNIDCILISTYDLIKNSKMIYINKKGKLDSVEQMMVRSYKSNDYFNDLSFSWDIIPETLVIFDEAHKCKNAQTQNSELLVSLSKLPNRILCLSASFGEDPIRLYGPSRAMDLWKDPWDFYREFLPNHFCIKENIRGHDVWTYKGGNWGMLKINAELKGRIFKMDIKQARRDGMFPNTNIVPDIIYSDNKEEFKLAWFKYKNATLTERQAILMEIELLKVNIIAEKASEFIEQGYAVACFVNYTNSLLELGKLLRTSCFFHGKQSGDINESNRLKFHENKSNIIILNIASGGASIDLHDKYHIKPRISIISPSYSAINLLQTLGRIDRAGGTDTTQYIIYIGDTLESEIANSLRNKIGNLNALTDTDINPINYLG